MNSIQIADETFVAADPAEVGRAVGDPASWRRWWPDLLLTVVDDRGELGHRWTVAGVAAWQLAKMNLAKMNHRRRVAGKDMAFEVKRTLESSRPVGVSRLA
jgi:hypothetical protein